MNIIEAILSLMRSKRDTAKEIKAFEQATEKKAKDQGRSHGENNPPPAGSDPLTLPYLSVVRGSSQRFIDDLAGSIIPTMERCRTRFEQAFQKQFSVIQHLLSERKEENRSLTQAITEATSASDERKKELEKAIPKQEKVVSNLDQRFSELTRTPVFTRIVLFTMGLGGLGSGEVFANVPSFLATVAPTYIEAILLSTAVAFSTISIGYAIGRTYLHQEYSRLRKATLMGSLFCLALCVYLTLSLLRDDAITVITNASQQFNSWVTFLLLNTCFLVAMICLEIFVLPSPQVFAQNRAFKQLKRSLKTQKRLLASLRNDLLSLPDQLEATLLKLRKASKKRVDTLNITLQKRYAQIRNEQVEYNKLLGSAQVLYEEVNAIQNNGMGIYLQELQSFRDDGVVIAMPSKGFPPLDNPFASYSEINDRSLTDLLAEIEDDSFDSVDIDFSSINNSI